MSKIIFLLGIGSSGKSTVANELLKHLGDSYILKGFDYAVESSLDKKYWPGGRNEHEGFYVENILGVSPELKAGPIGEAFLKKMLVEIIKLAEEGQNLIIDMVPSDTEYHQLISAFSKHQMLSVGIKPPLDIIIQRENDRKDRRAGTAKAAYERFYANKIFDIEIDSSKISAFDAANLIIKELNSKKSYRRS